MRKTDAAIIEPKNIFWGAPNAPVTLLEFADYETESAATVHAWIKEFLFLYEGKLRFSFRHFPLRHIHQKAQKAAEAAVAAAQEGKFWEMHEMLLQNRRNLGTISLKSYAKAIGVTNKRFLDELINGTYGWSVQDDLNEGLLMGVTQVPTFLINDKRLEEPVTKESLQLKLEEAIAQLK